MRMGTIEGKMRICDHLSQEKIGEPVVTARLTDHRSSFRSHPAHSEVADIAQVTVAAKAPPRSSMRTS